MKTVFNNRELSHIFASQSQDEGRGSNMSFRGGVLYSYSTAIYRIASFKGKQYLIENSNRFSNTTGKHQSYAWRALHHIEPCFSVDRGRGTDLDLSPKDIVREYEERAKEAAKETHKLRRKQYEIYMESARWWQKAVEAAEFFRMGTYGRRQGVAMMEKLAEPFKADYDKFHAASEERREKAAATRSRNEELRDAQLAEQRRPSIEAFLADFKVEDVPSEWIVPPEQKEAFRAQRAKREEWEAEKAKEDLEKWTRGEEVESSLWNLPVRLRACNEGAGLSGPRDIETSHGAVIPYEDGRRAFRFIQRHKGKAWHRNGEKCPVGHYQIDAILEDGSIRAGCHVIQASEILRFAQAEGWIQSTEAEAAQ
jgi:hypothetical protein